MDLLRSQSAWVGDVLLTKSTANNKSLDEDAPKHQKQRRKKSNNTFASLPSPELPKLRRFRYQTYTRYRLIHTLYLCLLFLASSPVLVLASPKAKAGVFGGVPIIDEKGKSYWN